MSEESSKLESDIFKDIKFFISGEVQEQVVDLLKNGGAERLNYFSDYVTHLIVGGNPEENDIVDANDVYEIPALTPKWVVMCATLKRLVSTKPYIYTLGGKLFTNLIFCLSGVKEELSEDIDYLWASITFNGGTVQLNLNKKCNYLVTTAISGKKIKKAEELGPDIIKIITPDWVQESVKNNCLVEASLFHPKLLDWPKPLKHESTTSITGFDPEQAETIEQVEEKSVSDSTQALLDKLKQRMPWNQPSTTRASSADPVGPPNVAPSFVQKSGQHIGQAFRPPMQNAVFQQPSAQPPISSVLSQIPKTSSTSLPSQIPSSIVHHTPNQQSQQEQMFQLQQSHPLNISRLIGQSQTKPSLPNLKGPLGYAHHVQVMQQQLTHLDQQNIQRTAIQQQLVQQQLVQSQLGSGSSLQNQHNQSSLPVQGVQNQVLYNQQHVGTNNQQQISQFQQLQLKQNQQQQTSNHQQMSTMLSQQQQISTLQQGIISHQQVTNLVSNTQQHVSNQPQQVANQQSQMITPQQIQVNQKQPGQNQQIQVNPLHVNQQLNQGQQVQQLIHSQQQMQISQNQTQMQLNQNQQQMQLNQNQQHMQLNQNPQQIQISQNQQSLNQQLIQNQVLQHQTQLNSQSSKPVNQQQSQSNQHVQMGKGQNFSQASINQHIISQSNQQLLQQKQFLNQQQNNNGQQQLLQNQSNLGLQQHQFSTTNFSQSVNKDQQNVIQQGLNSGLNQGINQQLNVQTLNQQLSTQNLGQQLNQQQLNQHLNQQGLLGQQLNQPQNSQISQEPQISSQSQLNSMGPNMSQQVLNQQQQQQLNQQQLSRQNVQPQINRQTLQAQQQQSPNQAALPHQLSQMTQQVNPGLSQQAVRAPFQPPVKLGQQILINQASPQNAQSQRNIWAQQPGQVPGQQIIRHPVNIVQQGGPRVQWSPNSQQGNAVPQRQFIQLDARTHNELQKMSPEQQALFVAKLRHRQLQQRGSHILIRGNVPPGLTTQQQVQWLQQQAKQQGIVLPPNIQQQNITPGTLTQPGLVQQSVQQAAPGLSPINQNTTQFTDQNQQQQLHLRQYRLQQLQIQREQAQKNHLAQQQGPIQQPPAIVRPICQPPLADSTTNPPQVQDGNIQHSLVVNAKTKTALANMLSIKLQSGGSSVGVQRPEAVPEPSAAGTLRLMTAQHNAALNSKPQEIIALQRRTISGPNGEIIKPPGTQPLPVTPTNEPLKLQYCSKSSLPVQHRPGPFYGHNPNLKLPPDLFLLGCIFVVVEIETFLEEMLPGWQRRIEKHGGEVEKQYCSRVTHVLCETQRHGVVMQALRDLKRCVTILWLSDVFHRKQVLPPWTALHLPNIYLDTTPASKHLISISGFEGSDRCRVKQMIHCTGAKFTSYFTKHNTMLISAKADGKKCAYAKKWQIPVVNLQWLTDIMLGHFTAMNQMEQQVYQQFTTLLNFSFDPKLVPNLMVAWKAPINISQESYERVKRSTSPVVLPKKIKKAKIEPTDENDNISEEHITNSYYRILFSMLSDTKELKQMVRDLGGAVAKDQKDFTHLVMPYLARSNKLFFAVSKGTHIVSDQWLRESHEVKQFLPESNYSLNSKEFNYEYKCDIHQTLLTKNRNKLLEGKFFFITPSIFPSKKIVAELIQCCGGIVERIRRSACQIEATNVNSPYSYFIITHENDLHLVADLLKNKKDKIRIICNAELIFSAILKQTFEIEPYAVSVL